MPASEADNFWQHDQWLARADSPRQALRVLDLYPAKFVHNCEPALNERSRMTTDPLRQSGSLRPEGCIYLDANRNTLSVTACTLATEADGERRVLCVLIRHFVRCALFTNKYYNLPQASVALACLPHNRLPADTLAGALE
jgi:hypothetical protein